MTDHCPFLAHHDFWLHRKNQSQSADSRHGRTCCRLDPVAIDPRSDLASYRQLSVWLSGRGKQAVMPDSSCAWNFAAADFGQLAHCSRTTSFKTAQNAQLWAFARIFSARCLKLPRAGGLTTGFPSLRIRNTVPFSGTDGEQVARP